MPKRSNTIKFVSLFLMIVFLLSPISFAAAAASSTTSIYFNGKRISSIDSNSTRLYYHQDYLGSIRIITGKNGAQLARLDYEPFGRELVDSTKTRYKFTGKEEDATGYDYFGARYYDSGTGRFTQVDTLYDSLASPYIYTSNNPLRFVDPSGREPVSAQSDTAFAGRGSIADLPESEQQFLLTGMPPVTARQAAINKFLPAEASVFAAAAGSALPVKWAVYIVRTAAIANLAFTAGVKITPDDRQRAKEEVDTEILNAIRVLGHSSGEVISLNNHYQDEIEKRATGYWNKRLLGAVTTTALTFAPWESVFRLFRKGSPIKALEPVETGQSTLLKHAGPHVPTSGPVAFQTPFGEVSAVTRKQAMGNQGAPPLITQDGKPVNSLVDSWMRTHHPDLWPR